MLAALDSSTKYAGVALWDERGLLAEANWLAGTNHTRQLMPNLVRLLAEQGAEAKDLRVVAAALGPGSFNGLRVAVSAAKGLCLGLGVPLVGLGTLAYTAYAQRSAHLPICALVDAGRGQLYGALFDPRDETWPTEGKSGIAPLGELLDRLAGPTVFCGEISAAGAMLAQERLGNGALIADPSTGHRRAACLAELGWKRFWAGQFTDLATAQPVYVQRPAVPPAPR